MNSFLQEINQLPPLLCVLCARERGRKRIPIPIKKIAQLASMTQQRAVWIYGQEWWDDVPVAEVDRFMRACGVTKTNLKAQLRYLRRTRAAGTPLAHVELLDRRTAKRMAERVAALMDRLATP